VELAFFAADCYRRAFFYGHASRYYRAFLDAAPSHPRAGAARRLLASITR